MTEARYSLRCNRISLAEGARGCVLLQPQCSALACFSLQPSAARQIATCCSCYPAIFGLCHSRTMLAANVQTFDEMLLLKRGGSVIYNGPLGKQSKDMIAYFESLPGVDPIAEGYSASLLLSTSNASVPVAVLRTSTSHPRLAIDKSLTWSPIL